MGRKRPLAVHIRFGVQGKSTLVQCQGRIGSGRSRLGLLNTDSRATGKPARPFYSVVSKRKKHGNGTGRFREGNGRLNLGEQIHGS